MSSLSMGRRDAIAAGLVALGVGALALLGAFQAAEVGTLDWRFRVRGARALAAPVAIVAIDERSLSALGQMPWSRKTFGALLDRLREGGAAAVALDIAFSEPGAREPGEDVALRDALGRFGPAILAVFRPLESAPSAGSELIRPIDPLGSAAWGFGLAHFGVAADLAVHRAEPQQPAGDALVPTLGLALARAYAATPAGAKTAPGFASRPVPAEIALDLAGPPGKIPTYSAIDVLRQPELARRLAGAAVLIGATAAGLPDTGFRSGFRGAYSGVELHATVAENLLGDGGLRQPTGAEALAGWAILAILSGWPLAATRLAPRARLAHLGAGLGLLLVAGESLFWAGVWLPVVAPAMLLAGCALAGILRQEGDLLRERARLLGWYADELAREAKRQRELIDGELHDEAQQLLVVMSREARKLEKALGEGRLGQLPELLARTTDEIIRVRKALVPHTLSRQGLRAAAEEMVREAVVRSRPTVVELEDDGWPDAVDPLLESEFYWLLKEALNNALEHARATRVTVRLGAGGGKLRVEIADNGKGFSVPPLDRPPQTHEHTGLHRMWVRARGLGGQMRVSAVVGAGSRVVFEIPLRIMADARMRKAAHL